jgi:hypothetical protein
MRTTLQPISLLVLAGALLLAGLYGVTSPGETSGATAHCKQRNDAGKCIKSNFRTLSLREDRFLNYDGGCPDNFDCFKPTNVDWPVDLIFWNGAEIDKVKTAMAQGAGYSFRGSEENFKLNNSGDWQIDGDKGVKTVLCPIDSGIHFRIYAPPTDHLYNQSWGFYVLGTSHYDGRECPGWDSWFGASEIAEEQITADAQAVFGGSAVGYDKVNMHNPEGERWEGNHYWLNSGYATAIKVCCRN